MSSEFQPDRFDVVQQAMFRTVSQFEAHKAVFEAAAERLHERLPLLALSPKKILDLGSRNGYQTERLKSLFESAEIVSADPSPSSVAKPQSAWQKLNPLQKRHLPTPIRCDPHELPFEAESFDLVISNLLLPWCHSPHQIFSEISRVLGQEGALLFSTAGPDTLIEYRALWAQIDSYPHAYGLVDMHDLGDAMLKHGLTAPVLDRENITVSYPSLNALELELRAVGAVNLAHGRRRGLMSPNVKNRLRQSLKEESIAVTLELVQGHAWKSGLPGAQTVSADGVHVPLDSLRRSLRRR
jgi:malonyl-CoA O-methyltransferase